MLVENSSTFQPLGVPAPAITYRPLRQNRVVKVIYKFDISIFFPLAAILRLLNVSEVLSNKGGLFYIQLSIDIQNVV